MKYNLIILALLLIAGISSAADVTVYNDYYVTANTSYDWTLDKTADVSELIFQPAPDPNPQVVNFTVAITRSDPYSLAQKHGTIHIYNNDLVNPVTITRVLDSLVYLENGVPPGIFVDETLLFEGSHTIAAGGNWSIPYVFTFNTPYPIGPFAYHYNFVNVLTDGNELFQYYDAFHVDFPGVVNETLHVWDEYTVPAGFDAVPTWNPLYNGTYWTTVAGNATLYLSLSITNQSAAPGEYTLKNKGSGINECGLWQDSVLITLRDTTPPDTFPGDTWPGVGFTPGYWKNHPDAFDQWLPITIATVNVTTVPQAINILSTNNPAWPRFLKFFLAMKFNCLYAPSMLTAFYNDTSKTGEYMENQTVAYIISVADGFTSSTPVATLDAMKNIFDAICNNNEVLWLNPQGFSFNLPTVSSFSLIPNPFKNGTEIRFSANVQGPVTLSIYDVSGAKVRDLVANGNSTLFWDGTDNNGKLLTRGVYIIRANNSTLKALINR